MAALALTVAGMVVQQLATAGWEKVLTSLGGLWRRAHPDQVATIVAELRSTRSEILNARSARDVVTERRLVGEWETRLHELLTADPELAEELRRLLADHGTGVEESRTVITQSVNAYGDSQVIQAAGDVTISGNIDR